MSKTNFLAAEHWRILSAKIVASPLTVRASMPRGAAAHAPGLNQGAAGRFEAGRGHLRAVAEEGQGVHGAQEPSAKGLGVRGRVLEVPAVQGLRVRGAGQRPPCVGRAGGDRRAVAAVDPLRVAVLQVDRRDRGAARDDGRLRRREDRQGPGGAEDLHPFVSA